MYLKHAHPLETVCIYLSCICAHHEALVPTSAIRLSSVGCHLSGSSLCIWMYLAELSCNIRFQPGLWENDVPGFFAFMPRNPIHRAESDSGHKSGFES